MTLPSGTLITVYEPNEVGHFDEALILVSDLTDEPTGTLISIYSFNGVGNYDSQLVLVSDIGDLPEGSEAWVQEPNGVGWYDAVLVAVTELNPSTAARLTLGVDMLKLGSDQLVLGT